MLFQNLSRVLCLSLLFVLCNCHKGQGQAPVHKELVSDYPVIRLEALPPADNTDFEKKTGAFEEKLKKSFPKNQDLEKTVSLALAPDAMQLGLEYRLLDHVRDQFNGENYQKITSQVKERICGKLVINGLKQEDMHLRSFYQQLINNLFQYQDYYAYLYAYCNQSKIRPGQEAQISVYNYGSWGDGHRKDIKVIFQISKLALDSLYQPAGFKIVKKDSLNRLVDENHSTIVLGDTLKDPGIYRLTVYSDRNFYDFYVQATLLDLVSKRTTDQLLVWASSYKDSLKGPYDIGLLWGAGRHLRVKTKKDGTAFFKIQADSAAAAEIQTVAALGEQYAFSAGSA
jgi:hypothetical protein